MRHLPLRLSSAGLVFSLLLAATAPSAIASGKYVESPEAVFPEAQPGRALLIVFRDESVRFLSQSLNVLVDDIPVAFLRGRMYASAQVEPGVRLLWGPPENVPAWIDFQAGRTYLFRIDETWVSTYAPPPAASTRRLSRTTWETKDPASIRNVVAVGELTYVSLTPDGVEDLKDYAAKKIEKARKVAGAPPAAAATLASGIVASLPLHCEHVWYRPRKKGASLLAWKLRGSLTITEDKVELISEDETLTIPVAIMRSVKTGTMGMDGTNDWAIAEYGPAGATELAGFRPPPTSKDEGCPAQTIAAAMGAAFEGVTLTPLKKVERAIDAAEIFEASGAGRDDFARDLSAALGGAQVSDPATKLREIDPVLSDHLENNSRDVDALFLQVRLDRALAVLTPNVITNGKLEPSPGPHRDTQATLDRILELSPGNAQAYYMKARLYGLSDPMAGGSHDLEKAVQYAGLAVEKAPDWVPYREALSLYLVAAGREAEAAAALEKIPGDEHPIHRLLMDRARVPLPEGAVPTPESASGLAEMEMSSGHVTSYPTLRISAYAVASSAKEVEAFYMSRWKELKLFEMKDGSGTEPDDMPMYGVDFEWRGDDLVPIQKAPSRDHNPEGSCLSIVVLEMRNPTPEARERMHLPSGDVVCQIVIRNLRVLEGETGGR